jgi:diguanylate cyclase (GGDEF)-like protein/PAS domain S-box-containing protein
MSTAVFPANEVERQRELISYQILDTAPDSAFDNLVALAAEICEVPIATVSLIDNDRQWFKSKLGVESTQTPRDQAFCAHAIVNPRELMVIADASKDSRFAENPLVTGDPNIRFYAGAPLVSSNGHGLGTLCVIDREPRTLRPSQEKALHALSLQVTQLLELHRQRAMAENHRRFLRTVMETLAEGVIVRDSQRTLISHNTMASVLLGTKLEDCVGKTFSMLQYKPVQPDGFPMPTEELPSYKALATGEHQRNIVFGITRPNKSEIWLESNATVLRDPIHGDCAVISFRDISDRKELEKQLVREATSDPLTGLPNRRALLAQVEKAMSAATRYKHPMSLCVADLDHLKSVNDKYGHIAGDAALRHFATILRATLRHEDSAARLGGDEFVALFPYVAAAQAATSLERMQLTLANAQLRLESGKEVTLSGSFGVADWKPGMTPEQLLEAADKVLYEAKTKGRNRIAVGA